MQRRHVGLSTLCWALLMGGVACSSADDDRAEPTTAAVATDEAEGGSTTTEARASTASPVTTVETTTTVPREMPGQPTASGRDPDGPFCQAIGRLNDGTDDPGDLDGYTFLAAVADRLLAASPPDSLIPDLTAFRETMGGIDAAQAAGQPAIAGFIPLTAPELIDVEHRIALGVGEECGILLSDPDSWPPQTTATGVPTGDLATSVCPGWPNQTNAVFNNRFPYTIDVSGANYWGFRYQVVPGGRIELRGEYPFARYYSILPNDQDTNNLRPQTDVQIEPDPGSTNPWRTTDAVDGPRRFTLTFSFDPPPAGEPQPNTSYLGAKKDGVTPNSGGTVVLRIYGSDEGNAPNSAGVPLPSVTTYGPDGSVVSHHDECDPFPAGPPAVDPADVPAFPPLPFPAQYTTPEPIALLSSTYGVPVDLLANPDVQYVNLRMSHRFGDVFVVRAKAFTTPDTRGGDSPDYSDFDIQGWTVCNYNLVAGIAQTCLMDHEIPVDDDGFYTLVVSSADDRPATATAENDVAWFDWGPYLDNHITWRMFPRNSPLVAAVNADVTSGEGQNPYTPTAVYCDRATFETGGWEQCFEGVD